MATVEINLQSYQYHGYLSGFQIVPSGQVPQLLDLYWPAPAAARWHVDTTDGLVAH